MAIPETPMTDRLYFADSHLLEFDATVTGACERDGRIAVALDRTAFYPTGGGQPFDTGLLGDACVSDVVETQDGEILHILAEPAGLTVGASVTCRVDAGRRRDHMQQHTGQHILSAAFEHLFDAETKGFRMGADAAEIDVELSDPTDERIADAESLANRIVTSDLDVRIHNVDRDGAARLPLRKQSDRDGTLRIVEIDGFDWSPCGGTHAHRSGEVGAILVSGVERAKRMARITFVCGGRAVAEYRRANRTALATARLFSTGRDDAPPLVARLVDENRQLKRRVRDLAEVASAVEGADLHASGTERDGYRLVARRLDGRSADELRLLAHAVLAAGPSVVLLGSDDGGTARLVFARSDAPAADSVDCGALMRSACEAVGGRGGGKPDFAQGGGPEASGLDEALTAAVAGTGLPG